MSYSAEKKPHAILIPFPLQGHINPMLKLAKLLHLRGFHITFVNTEYNHKRLLKSKGPNSLDGFTDFNFETIPDGLTPMDGDDVDVSQDIPSLCQSIRKNIYQHFCELLARLHDSSIAGLVPPVTCIVSDCYMSFTIQAAEQHALPILLFFPPSACTLLITLHVPTLIEEGLIPLKDESYKTNGYLDTKVDCIPGLHNIRLKDLPDFIQTTNRNDIMLEFGIDVADKVRKASAIAFNTYNELESDVLIFGKKIPSVWIGLNQRNLSLLFM
ncbi:unnamed protein product [Vicia faba]|uniref:Uncharacterized protein n=1 Tax=Vicia faba TaxID=3906 RepID=A0AAV0Z9R8_VICFA|nr:unnamed protein product [Vicia faba]